MERSIYYQTKPIYLSIINKQMSKNKEKIIKDTSKKNNIKKQNNKENDIPCKIL